MNVGTIILICFAVVVFVGLLFSASLLERFWNWYDDAVWDEQEEDRPEPDDFPDSK